MAKNEPTKKIPDPGITKGYSGKSAEVVPQGNTAGTKFGQDPYKK